MACNPLNEPRILSGGAPSKRCPPAKICIQWPPHWWFLRGCLGLGQSPVAKVIPFFPVSLYQWTVWCTYVTHMFKRIAESPCFSRASLDLSRSVEGASVLIYQARFQHDADATWELHLKMLPRVNALQRGDVDRKPHRILKLRKSFVTTLSEIQEDDLRNDLGTCNHYDLQAANPLVCCFQRAFFHMSNKKRMKTWPTCYVKGRT